MTRLWNDPADFAEEMIEGFVAANPFTVRRVPGGVARSTVVPDGQVAVVIGGGSGHYPAFGGLVGAGLAHAAAMGNLFASPSAQQVQSVARDVHAGGGVLLTYGNYAGDVLNFDTAQERLIAEGIDVRTVTVTDDIMSAQVDEKHRRRGIAGDLTVFRAAAAAAEAGYDLDGVAAVAAKANERTRTLGVAFSGCTLPGADRPLFEVPEGRMAVGLGIHGEPGLEETDVPSADELADLLVRGLLEPAERPDGVGGLEGARVVPVLNGLGSLKYEEMFVVYRRIDRLLAEAGIAVVDPHVGEFCTSFDMAGTSLTLFWLDDELETLWSAPVDTPAYRRGRVDARPSISAADLHGAVASGARIPEADEESRALARRALECLRATARIVAAHAYELGRLDAVAGDGDHGIGMTRGSSAAADAAAKAVEEGAGAETTLARAAEAWADRAGGTSGALWGVIVQSVGEALKDTGSRSARDVADGVGVAAEAVMRRGGAATGDKTLVDALVPFSRVLEAQVESGAPLAAAWAAAARAATEAAAHTAALLPRMGRARSHGEHAVGSPDPGAVSLALIATEIGSVLSGVDTRPPGKASS